MRDRFVTRHPVVDAEPAERCQREDEHCGQPDVQDPQPTRGLPDPLGQLCDLGAGHLGLEHLAPADPQPGQHAIARTMIPIPPSHWVN